MKFDIGDQFEPGFKMHGVSVIRLTILQADHHMREYKADCEFYDRPSEIHTFSESVLEEPSYWRLVNKLPNGSQSSMPQGLDAKESVAVTSVNGVPQFVAFEGITPAKPQGCFHERFNYLGLSESYVMCKKCGIKL